MKTAQSPQEVPDESSTVCPQDCPTGRSALGSDLLLHVIVAECSAELGAAEQERQVVPHQPETTSGFSSSSSKTPPLSSITCTNKTTLVLALLTWYWPKVYQEKIHHIITPAAA